MIRQRRGEQYLLISQVEHARLAAEIAAAVGNALFAAPLPRETVLSAVLDHDAGWPAHDDQPTVNASGEPTCVFEMPLERDLAIWQASTDIAAARHDYAGLLVSLHGVGLSARATPHTPREKFAMLKFQQRQFEIQEQLRRRLGMDVDTVLFHGLAKPGRAPDEDLLLFNFHLLQLADQLSLNLCFGAPRLPSVENIFTRPGANAVALRVAQIGGEFSVSPWPFATHRIETRIAARPVPARPYADHDDLRREFAQAPAEQLTAVMRAGELPA